MQKDKTGEREMATTFEGIFLFKMVFSVEFPLRAISFDFRCNLLLQLKCVVY